jgi:anthranilate synthase
MDSITYTTPGGIGIRREALTANYADGVSPLISALDSRRGVLLASSFEYPGRYTRWDIGFVDPPVEITA